MSICLLYRATMAQLVEQRIRNARVKGSNPFGGSNPPNGLMRGGFFLTCNDIIAIQSGRIYEKSTCRAAQKPVQYGIITNILKTINYLLPFCLISFIVSIKLILII